MNFFPCPPLVAIGLACVAVLAQTAGTKACDLFGGQKSTTVNYGTCPTPVVSVATYVPACRSCSVPACPAPQPIAVTQTCMTQRCYMAPVTTYRTRTAYENVTTLRTSYYTEPVTTMHTSAYYDPCSCSYYNIATPVTSYVQRAKVEPVVTTVTRNYLEPVTTYQKRCVSEPVTQIQYYYPSQSVPVAAVPATTATPSVAYYWSPVPVVVAAPQTQQPTTTQRNYPPTQADENGTLLIERFYDENGQFKFETRKDLKPGESIPPARKPEERATDATFLPNQQPSIGSSVVQMVANPYYR